MERVVRERMTTQDVEPSRRNPDQHPPGRCRAEGVLGTSQLSQFMDQNNPWPD